MNDANLALLPILLPLTGAAVALFAKACTHPALSRALDRLAAVIGLFLPFAALAFLYPLVRSAPLVFAVGGRGLELGILQRFDGTTWLIDLLGFTLAAVAWIYSCGAGPRGPLFTMLFLIQTAALAATASCADLFNLFVCLEVLGLASYALTAFSHKGPAYLAAFSYLAVSSAAMCFFLLGVFGFYRLTGSLSYEGIADGLAALEGGGGRSAILSLSCVVVSVAVRVAVLPVYGWLPDAHATAPHAVSAVLSGVLIKTPLFALGRVIAAMSAATDLGERSLALLGAAGAATALIAVVVALCQRDAKRLLAYHSISQIGYIVAAWALFSPHSISAAWFHAFSHALFKGLLFLSVGTTVDALGDRDIYRARGATAALRKSGDRAFLTTVCFAVGALSIAAMPPFNGYASKNAIVSLFGSSWQGWILNAASVGTIASMIKLSMIFFPAVRGAEVKATAFRVELPMAASMAFLALLCIATGIFAPEVVAAADSLMGSSAAYGSVFSVAKLVKTALSIPIGAAVFLAAVSPIGKRAASLIRGRSRSFGGLLVGFAAALVVFAAWLSA